MVDFLNEVPDATESAATFSTFSSTVNPFGRSSFSTSTDNPINCFNSVGQTNFAESQAVISLAELTNEYTAYLILNVSRLISLDDYLKFPCHVVISSRFGGDNYATCSITNSNTLRRSVNPVWSLKCFYWCINKASISPRLPDRRLL